MIKTIGIFDSGIGGLTILKTLFKSYPDKKFIYLADTLNFPYGGKAERDIMQYINNNFNFLINKKADVIIIACNTASAIACKNKQYFKNVCFIDVINPTINCAFNNKNVNKIGIIGTTSTIQSNSYQNIIKKINSNIKIYSKATPLLVPLIEEFHNIEKKLFFKVLDFYLKDFKIKNIDTLILGCTHYIIIKEYIKKYFSNKVRVVDATQGIVNFIDPLVTIKNENINKVYKTKIEFFSTMAPVSFSEKINLILKIKAKTKLARV